MYIDIQHDLKDAALSLANSKIITRFERVNFDSLFWLEEDGWTERFVEYPEQIVPNRYWGSQLLTVKNLKPER